MNESKWGKEDKRKYKKELFSVEEKNQKENQERKRD